MPSVQQTTEKKLRNADTYQYNSKLYRTLFDNFPPKQFDIMKRSVHSQLREFACWCVVELCHRVGTKQVISLVVDQDVTQVRHRGTWSLTLSMSGISLTFVPRTRARIRLLHYGADYR